MSVTITVSATDAVGATSTTTTTATQNSAWPNATNTGVPAGTTLTNSNAITTTANGQVINALRVNGNVNVIHDDVVIQNSLINGTILASSQDFPGHTMRRMIVRDCEINGQNVNEYPNSCINIVGAAVTAPYAISDPSPADGAQILRCNIWNRENGLWIECNDTLIQDCYIHDIRNFAQADPHLDGVQIPWGGGASSMVRRTVIRHCNFDCPDGSDGHTGTSSCITWAGVDTIMVDNCRLKNGAHLVDNGGPSHNITIQNCEFHPQIMGTGPQYWFCVSNESGSDPAVEVNNITYDINGNVMPET